MANWVSITIDDIEDSKVAKLVTALRTRALADDQDDPTPELTQRVVDEVRRKIASNTSNRLDEDVTTVPKGLKSMVTELVYFKLKGRLNKSLTSDEKEDKRQYERELNRIAEGKDVVEQPDTPVEAEIESPAPSPSVGKRTKRYDRNSQDGI